MKRWTLPSLPPGSNLRPCTCLIIYHDNTGLDIERSIEVALILQACRVAPLVAVCVHQRPAQPQRCPGY